MTKYAAFGTVLNMGTGAVQVETATVVGTITNPGDLAVVVTCTGMTGSPITLAVPATNGNADQQAATIRAFLQTDASAAAIRELFEISGATDKVILTRKLPMANISNLNIATATGTATGLTTTASSANTTAGETLGAVAKIKGMGGPGLSLDTEDVTTHDQATAWEEVVATILRTGELSLDIIYDPADASLDASTGLIGNLDDRLLVGYSIVFPGSVTWAFAAYTNGFEPGAPVDGALTAKGKLKISGAPVLS